MSSETFALQSGCVLASDKRNYKVVKVLGSGGFGVTYLAKGKIKVENVWVEGFFAIKELFPSDFVRREGTMLVPTDNHVAEFHKAKADFLLEANRLQQIGALHDNIVKVNEVFEANGTAYYVMQYVNGRTLYEYVNEYGALPFDFAFKLISPVMQAVEFLHNQRINHFDIKPDNVMLQMADDEIQPVLIDFGLSIHYRNDGNKTTARSFGGVSEGYAPIEQYADIKQFSPPTDVYGLAATLVYMLTATPPAPAPSMKINELRAQLIEKVPANIADAICRAMATTPEQRTQSVAQFRNELTGGAPQQPAQQQPAQPRPQQPAQPAQPSPQQPAQAAAQQQPAQHRPQQRQATQPFFANMQPGAQPSPFATQQPTQQPNQAPRPMATPQPGQAPRPMATPQPGQAPQPMASPFPSGAPAAMPGTPSVKPGQPSVKPGAKKKGGIPVWLWIVIGSVIFIGVSLTILLLIGLSDDETNPIEEPATEVVEYPVDEEAVEEVVVEEVPAAEEAPATETVAPEAPAEETVQSSYGTLPWKNGTYRGDISNGKANGHGRISFSSEGKVDSRCSDIAYPGYYFEGYFTNGRIDSGYLYDSDGNTVSYIVP